METIRLGMTELEVTRIAFGTWQIGGEWGELRSAPGGRRDPPRARSRDQPLLRHRAGVRVRGLGASARRGASRRPRQPPRQGRDRDEGGLRDEDERPRDSGREWLRSGVEQSLRELGVEHIDLYQVHWPDPDTPFAETASALQELVDEGIRHVGVSNYDTEQIAEFAGTRPVETVQALYNLFHREIEADPLPFAREHDIGVLAYSPLAHGLLTGAMDETIFEPGDGRVLKPAVPGRDLSAQPGDRAGAGAIRRRRARGARLASWRSPGRLPTPPFTSRSSVPAKQRTSRTASGPSTSC